MKFCSWPRLDQKSLKTLLKNEQIKNIKNQNHKVSWALNSKF
jgi:hypothetical protein